MQILYYALLLCNVIGTNKIIYLEFVSLTSILHPARNHIARYFEETKNTFEPFLECIYFITIHVPKGAIDERSY